MRPLEPIPERVHAWDLPPEQAIELQRRLHGLVRQEPPEQPWRTVCGCDVSYDAKLDLFFAAVIVLSLRDLSELDRAETFGRISYPYVPGLLSFREAPILLEALGRLRVRPDVLMLDGQGLAHPRRFGLACHVGVLLDIPAVGCAKTRLTGSFEDPPPEAGSWRPMKDKGEVVGAALRTRKRGAPVYVSIGHGSDLPSAIRLVLDSCAGLKLPEPTRRADLVVKEALRKYRASVQE